MWFGSVRFKKKKKIQDPIRAVVTKTHPLNFDFVHFSISFRSIECEYPPKSTKARGRRFWGSLQRIYKRIR